MSALRLLLVFTTALIVVGCAAAPIYFENPATANVVSDYSAYMGDWNLIRAPFAITNSSTTLSIFATSGGQLRARLETYAEGHTDVQETEIRPIPMGGAIVVSARLRDNQDQWILFLASLSEDESRLLVRPLDPARVNDDVTNGTLDGEVVASGDLSGIVITASGDDVRQYIDNTNLAIFLSDSEAEFERPGKIQALAAHTNSLAGSSSERASGYGLLPAGSASMALGLLALTVAVWYIRRRRSMEN